MDSTAHRHALEAAASSVVASLPWWALESEALIIRLGALCAALLAIFRLVQLCLQATRARPVPIQIDPDED